MIYARKNKNERGEYVDTTAARWDVMFSATPYNPARWQQFDSEEACLESWKLTYDPPSPLQGYGVASPLPEPEGEQG